MRAEEKYLWPMPNSELAKILRVKEKNIRQHQSNHKADFVEGKGKDYWRGYLDVPNAPPMTLWSKEGAIKLAQHCRTSQAKAFLEEMGFKDLAPYYPPEGRLLDIIESAMNGVSACYRQHFIAGFRVDLYLKDLNLAIECDEHDHKHSPKWYEGWRQEEIEQRLGCKFVRFNPHEAGFNIGKIINVLISEIVRKA